MWMARCLAFYLRGLSGFAENGLKNMVQLGLDKAQVILPLK
jgi:hypothetical protein